MKITNGDIVFLRDGAPAVVKNVNHDDGKVVLERDLKKVQKQAEDGVINHLDEKQRASYKLSLNAVKDDTKQEEIQNLYDLIQNYRESKRIDPKVLHYLENELMHRMNRDGYTPPDYAVDLRNLPQN